MQILIFTIPVFDSQKQIEDMNKTLRGKNIIQIKECFVENKENSYWTFYVQYSDSSLAKSERTDYRKTLGEKVFEKFSRLREIRKQIAKEDSVQAYMVFTDEELSKVAGLDKITKESLLKIPGVGEKKVEKYMDKLLQLLAETKKDETSGKSP